MTKKYTGQADDRRYAGADIDITYSLKRCLHAAECTTHLAEVFDLKKRPWINADGASAERIASVIQICPSGALHYQPQDETLVETPSAINRIILRKDSYLQFIGNLAIQGAQVQIEDETRATLCRCGASERKPFCDNTHKKIDFVTTPLTVEEQSASEVSEQGDQLVITAHASGPYEVAGNFQIEDENGMILFTGNEAWLCRCGGSDNKPFCDNTHRKNGFGAE